MQVDINPRGNGACPLCKQNGQCRFQKTLVESMEPFEDKNMPMELVIYSCPYFKEKM
jgi:hypothetical protein